MSYQVIKTAGIITEAMTVSSTLNIDSDTQTSVTYADQATAIAAEPTLSGFLGARSALVSATPFGIPFVSAVHIGNVNVGPQPTLIIGNDISSATFDGTNCVIVFSKQWDDDQYNASVTPFGTNFNTVTYSVVGKTASGFTVNMVENSGVVQDVTLLIKIK